MDSDYKQKLVENNMRTERAEKRTAELIDRIMDRMYKIQTIRTPNAVWLGDIRTIVTEELNGKGS